MKFTVFSAIFVCLALALVTVRATDEAGTKFLAENAKRPGVVELPSGLQYEVIQAGQGGSKPRFVDEVSDV